MLILLAVKQMRQAHLDAISSTVCQQPLNEVARRRTAARVTDDMQHDVAFADSMITASFTSVLAMFGSST